MSGAYPEPMSRAEAWCWTWLVVAMLWVVYNLIDFAGWGLLACSGACAAVAAGGIVAVRRRAARRGGIEK